MNAGVVEAMGEGDFSSEKGILFFSFSSQDLYLNSSFLKASEASLDTHLYGGAENVLRAIS